MLPVIRKVFKELYNSIQNFDQIKAMYTYLLTYSVQQSPSWEANQFSRNSLQFRELKGSLPHLQVPTTCPYPETYQSSPFTTNSLPEDHPQPISWRSILILSSHLCQGLPSYFLPSGFPTNTLLASSQHNLYDTYYIPIAVCTVLDSWWWTEKLSKTCRVPFQK